MSIDSRGIARALCEIEYMLFSLGDMGYYYYLHPDRPPDADTDLAYAKETTRFVDENGICGRLSKIRGVLCEAMEEQLSKKEKKKLYRKLEKIKIWRKPGD